MCAFRKTISERGGWLPRNTRKAAGQCAENGGSRAEDFAATAPFAGVVAGFDWKKPAFYKGSGDGTAFAP
jgi:hypothetical protein